MRQTLEEAGGYGHLLLVECVGEWVCKSKNGRESRRVGVLQEKRNRALKGWERRESTGAGGLPAWDILKVLEHSE